MSKPKIDYNKKTIEYKGIEYEIIGSDIRAEPGGGRRDMCHIGKATIKEELGIEITTYLICLSGYKPGEVNGLDENNCLILNKYPYLTLQNAILDVLGEKKQDLKLY